MQNMHYKNVYMHKNDGLSPAQGPILSTSFLRLFYVIGIMKYANCILCIFYPDIPCMLLCKITTKFAGVQKKE